jgi:hypothetical protein
LGYQNLNEIFDLERIQCRADAESSEVGQRLLKYLKAVVSTVPTDAWHFGVGIIHIVNEGIVIVVDVNNREVRFVNSHSDGSREFQFSVATHGDVIQLLLSGELSIESAIRKSDMNIAPSTSIESTDHRQFHVELTSLFHIARILSNLEQN